MNEHIEEQPYDDRHSTPPVPPASPFKFEDLGDHIGNDTQQSFTSPERGKAQVYIDGHMTYREIPPNIPPNQPDGLSFTSGGITLIDLGHWAPNEGALTEMNTLDLRVLLAHLDSTGLAVKAELERRR